jgi:hypothetical protein
MAGRTGAVPDRWAATTAQAGISGTRTAVCGAGSGAASPADAAAAEDGEASARRPASPSLRRAASSAGAGASRRHTCATTTISSFSASGARRHQVRGSPR